MPKLPIPLVAVNFHTITTPASETAGNHRPTWERPQKLALVCDFLEERWPSMDLFGDMLFRFFTAEHAAEVEVRQLRPALRARFSRLSALGGSGLLWNADRLANRFYDYPRWLGMQANNFDLFHIVDHSYAQLALRLPPDRTVITCHDLDTFRCVLEPELEPRPRWFRAMVQRTLNGFLRASQVICPSAFTKADLLRHNLFASGQVSVIHPGADPIFFSASDPVARQDITRLVGGSDRVYLLHVGSTIRRKRIDVLLKVFAQVEKKFPHVRLVRVGGAFTAQQSRMAQDLGLEGKIIHAPHLSKVQLAACYREAAILLQTSDAEGFGLPIIEALACGCPVVASDIAPLREAGGQVAQYCPVADVEAWSETVVKLLAARETSAEAWQSLRDEARRHASRFTWSENANQTLDIYHRVLKAAVDA